LLFYFLKLERFDLVNGHTMSTFIGRSLKCSKIIFRYHQYTSQSIILLLTLVLLRYDKATSPLRKLGVKGFVVPVRVFRSHARKAPYSSHLKSLSAQDVNAHVPRMQKGVGQEKDESKLERNESITSIGDNELSYLRMKSKEPMGIHHNDHITSIEATTAAQSNEIFPKQMTMSVVALMAVSALFFLSSHQGGQAAGTNFDIKSFIDSTVLSIEKMGPYGILYFAAFYVLAEVLALPSMPLTASAGYLFGWQQGTVVVLISATIAAAISFVIARTFLREYVEDLLELNPKFKVIDRIVGKVRKR
jgi:hypothetical protein